MLLLSLLLRHPMLGNSKDLEPDDLYVGLARLGLDSKSALPPGVLGGIALAFDLDLLSTDAITLLVRAHPQLPRTLTKNYTKQKVKGGRRRAES